MKNTIDKKLAKWHEMYGDLSPETKAKLDKLVAQFNPSQTSSAVKDQAFTLKGIIGNCRFIREYNGKTHEVTSQNGVYTYKGRTYKSLSAIAYEITGTKWNGKRFFGVQK